MHMRMKMLSSKFVSYIPSTWIVTKRTCLCCYIRQLGSCGERRKESKARRRKQREDGVHFPPKNPRSKVLSKKALKRLQRQQDGGEVHGNNEQQEDSDKEEDDEDDKEEDDEVASVNTNPTSTISSTTNNYTFSDTVSIHSATSSMIVETEDA